MDRLTIGKVAKLACVSHDTIRLYERYGLIKEAPRASNRYRQYSKDTVARLKFIFRAKEMGLTLIGDWRITGHLPNFPVYLR